MIVDTANSLKVNLASRQDFDKWWDIKKVNNPIAIDVDDPFVDIPRETCGDAIGSKLVVSII